MSQEIQAKYNLNKRFRDVWFEKVFDFKRLMRKKNTAQLFIAQLALLCLSSTTPFCTKGTEAEWGTFFSLKVKQPRYDGL